MPELPEVETTRRGIAPLLEGQRVLRVTVHEPRLRWPVALPADLDGQRLQTVTRRAKYLLLRFETGTMIVHLGMSGSLRISDARAARRKHDHLELAFEGGRVLRLHDPRRFGSVHWHTGEASGHWLLAALGPEPFDAAFDAEYLKRQARGRRVAVKSFLMDSRIVVGVGNIYANEALFLAGIRPGVACSRVTLAAYEELVCAIRRVLGAAIRQGGTTLRDFVREDGAPGYFRQSLNVYGREGEPCRCCGRALTGVRLAQRATVYCRNCQKSQGFTPPRW